MRSDFSDKHTTNQKSKAKWNRARIIRAVLFIGLGLLIGFWLHNKPKADGTAGLAVNDLSPPEQVTEQVSLPTSRSA